jgi:hypothetical protein
VITELIGEAPLDHHLDPLPFEPQGEGVRADALAEDE